MSDAAIRAYVDGIAVPEFAEPVLVRPPRLDQARVAIVTTAAVHGPDAEGFLADDTGYRVVPRAERDLRLGHWSPNFDRTAFAADINVVFPIERLEELAREGVIGSVADSHYSFAGNQEDTVTRVRLDSGPAAARALLADKVDVVLLTPV